LGMAGETICWRVGTLPWRNVASRFSIIGPARQTRNMINILRPVQSHYCKLHHCAARQETKYPSKIFWVVLIISAALITLRWTLQSLETIAMFYVHGGFINIPSSAHQHNNHCRKKHANCFLEEKFS
jgi:hypothetical protein